MHALLMAMVLAASPALDEAKSHLKAGRIDDVYFALEGKQLPPEEHAAAADVLTEAGWKALAKKDPVMALQLARMAEKHGKKHEGALEVAARASHALKQFENAEGYTDRWLEAFPQSAEGHLFRAELAAQAGEWDIALSHLDVVKGPPAKSARFRDLRKRALKEYDAEASGLSTVKDLEKNLEQARAEAKKAPSRKLEPQARRRSGQVVVYTNSWCGYCKQATAWLANRGVAYVEKDVEEDLGAAKELAAKVQAASIAPDDLPAIDVRGELIFGFDEQKLDALLSRRAP